MVVRLLPILGITFIDILGFSILIPLMPFFVKHFGASDVVVGAVFATYSLCQLVAAPLWGNASDRIGRKTVLIVSQVGATIGWAMLAFAPNIAWVFVSRAIEGISGGNIGVTQAYVSDLVEPEQRGRAFALVGAAFSAGFVFGPAAGGFLSERYGFGVPFLLAAALQLLTLVVTIAILPESKATRGEEEGAATPRDIVRAFADGSVAPVLWMRLVYVLGIYGWFGAMTLIFNAQLGWDVATISYVFAAFGVLQVVMQLAAVGRITDALGNRAATNAGLALLVVAIAITPLAHGIVLPAIALMLFGIALSIENAAFAALASDKAADGKRGTVLGVMGGLDSFAGFLMPPITTAILGAAGVTPTAGLVAALIFVALVMGVLQARGEPARVAREVA